MNAQDLVFRYLPLMKKNWLALCLGILGMIFFAYGLIGIFSSGNSSPENIVFQSSEENTASKEVKTIMVDVEGAVVNPGIYKLPESSRIQDGLVAAGGLSAAADREYIAKNLNLATKLPDGAKVYIPPIGVTINGGSVPNTSSGDVLADTLTNINSASESQLDGLPGVGPVTVQKIVAGRPYNSVDELLSKKIVGAKVFDQIKGKITTY